MLFVIFLLALAVLVYFDGERVLPAVFVANLVFCARVAGSSIEGFWFHVWVGFVAAYIAFQFLNVSSVIADMCFGPREYESDDVCGFFVMWVLMAVAWAFVLAVRDMITMAGDHVVRFYLIFTFWWVVEVACNTVFAVEVFLLTPATRAREPEEVELGTLVVSAAVVEGGGGAPRPFLPERMLRFAGALVYGSLVVQPARALIGVLTVVRWVGEGRWREPSLLRLLEEDFHSRALARLLGDETTATFRDLSRRSPRGSESVMVIRARFGYSILFIILWVLAITDAAVCMAGGVNMCIKTDGNRFEKQELEVDLIVVLFWAPLSAILFISLRLASYSASKVVSEN
jgi:hypothetical protein